MSVSGRYGCHGISIDLRGCRVRAIARAIRYGPRPGEEAYFQAGGGEREPEHRGLGRVPPRGVSHTVKKAWRSTLFVLPLSSSRQRRRGGGDHRKGCLIACEGIAGAATYRRPDGDRLNRVLHPIHWSSSPPFAALRNDAGTRTRQLLIGRPLEGCCPLKGCRKLFGVWPCSLKPAPDRPVFPHRSPLG
jgi:hypothetical protein